MWLLLRKISHYNHSHSPLVTHTPSNFSDLDLKNKKLSDKMVNLVYLSSVPNLFTHRFHLSQYDDPLEKRHGTCLPNLDRKCQDYSKIPSSLPQTLKELKTEREHAAGQYFFPSHLVQGKHFNEKWTVLGGLLKMGECFPTNSNRDVLLCANNLALNNIDI